MTTATVTDLNIPVVVTQSLASGATNGYVPIWGFGGSQPGLVASDPVNGGFFNGMKAAFAQFLVLRHGANLDPNTGNWLLFSNNAERPFHSLSYPDINYTVMRPANLPPPTPSMPSPATAAYPPTAAAFLHSRLGDPQLVYQSLVAAQRDLNRRNLYR